MRLVGGVAVILGALGIFSSLSQGNLVGVAMSIAFIAGGVLLYRRSERVRRTGTSAV